MQQQLAGTLRKRTLVVYFHITGIKLLIFDVRASSTARWSGQQMDDRTQQSPEPCSMQQTLHPAATDNKCRQHLFNTAGNMKSKIPPPTKGTHDAGSPDLTRHEQHGFSPTSQTELSVIGFGQGQTPPHQMMTTRTSPLSPVNRPHHCIVVPIRPFGAACSLMYLCGLELVFLF